MNSSCACLGRLVKLANELNLANWNVPLIKDNISVARLYLPTLYFKHIGTYSYYTRQDMFNNTKLRKIRQFNYSYLDS